ncbi:MAG: hypothetical protein H0W78_19150 [Planctomycetes bacterium]|nr:hypothetical protein [Planctomycetota bacterium]
MSRILMLALTVMTALTAGDETPPAPTTVPVPAWSDLTDWLNGGAKGVSVVTLTPAGDQVLIGLPDRGLFASNDARKTWMPLGKDQAELTKKSWPCQVLFDPNDANSFWLASRTGAGLFATTDGGVTLTRVGNLEAISRAGIDVSDPKKKLLVVCRAEKERDLSRSINGGSFSKIGNKLPEQLLPITQVVVIDAKTWLVATGLPPAPNPKKKKEQEREAGIYRTDDAGASWLRCHKEGVGDAVLQRADRSLWWSVAGGERLLRSSNQGRTWTPVEGPTTCPTELPHGWIAAVKERQVMVSTNNGKLWQPLGPELPFFPAGILYAAKFNCLLAWRAPEMAGTEALVRFDLPEDLTTVIEVPPVRDLLVWNGDEEAKGGGWLWPEQAPMVKPAPAATAARVGKMGLAMHIEGVANGGFGWNWFGWFPKEAGSDVSAYEALVFSIRVDGAAKPTALRVQVKSNDNKGTAEVDLVPLYPSICDGRWHEVSVPLTTLRAGGQFNPATAWELAFNVSAPTAMTCDINVDEVGFTKTAKK